MTRKLTAGDLGVEDRKIFDRNNRSVVESYEELYHLVNFPPFRLSGNFEKAQKYIIELKSEYQKLRSSSAEDLIDPDFKPFKSFIRKYASNVAEARRYAKSSNKNIVKALDMYVAENPDSNVGDDEYYLPEQTPW